MNVVGNINGNSRFYPGCQQLTMHTVWQGEEEIERQVSSSATKIAGHFSVTVHVVTVSHVLVLRVKKSMLSNKHGYMCRHVQSGLVQRILAQAVNGDEYFRSTNSPFSKYWHEHQGSMCRPVLCGFYPVLQLPAAGGGHYQSLGSRLHDNLLAQGAPP